MSHIGTDQWAAAAGRRRGIALPVVAMLVSVLTVLSLAAVSFLLSSLNVGTDSGAEARATYVAELGRADAFAYVVRNSAGPWTGRALTPVVDDLGAGAGEYTYTITDLTMPEENQRCAVLVYGYWPNQSSAVASQELRFWMEKNGETWTMKGWALERGQGG
jgi:hypothetical protein